MKQVTILPYSSDWASSFEKVKHELLQALPDTKLEIEHIGSTAVPGLSAKPVIDVALGVLHLNEIEKQLDQLRQLDYQYIDRYEVELPQRRYFVKDEVDGLRVHVHGLVIGDRLWREHLFFRDQLRGNHQLRDEYERLKLELARRHRDNKALYTEAKAPFIRAVLDMMPN